ncbi:MAG: response regulator [Pseudanabaena sp.]
MRCYDPILLVEDSLIDIMILKRGLKEINAHNPLHVSHDGESALQFLKEQNQNYPVLILLDINMPRMNGLEFLAMIKQSPQWRRIPVVVLTTSQEDCDRQTSFELGAAGYVVKPLSYSVFVEHLKVIYEYWCLSESPHSPHSMS